MSDAKRRQRTRTMYMHTLDGRPANFERVGGRAHLYVLRQRSVAKLAPSLRQIREEWNASAYAYVALCANDYHAGVEYVQRCGYVLVEVPA